ncbi:hypothetical protein [Erythrobacter sp. HKB08]|uniref:hypothetical protein n=1 Tax=Erythrobacter sp. HKB08 TaxID=2502843 RepID=UPI0010087C20|nr:hypothetical protein [Erythrobacter sp. HKB08]
MKLPRIYLAAAAALVALPSAAQADVAARYETVDDKAVIDMEMTIEADENDNVRFQMARTGGYFLLRDGEMYQVQKTVEGYEVVRTRDALLVQQEAMAKLGWKIPDMVNAPELAAPRLEPMEEETVGGRVGTGYGMVGQGMDGPIYASLVVSTDPELAPIGSAMASANENMLKGMGEMGSMLGMVGEDMLALMKQGAPLRMLSVELTDVSFDPIPQARFELPAEPMTLEQLRAALDVTVDAPPTLPARDRTGK